MELLNLDLLTDEREVIPFKQTLASPQDVVDYMEDVISRRPDQEQFWTILLDRRNRPIGRCLCALGTVSRVVVHPREVFRAAIIHAASSVVIVHNHPSGDPSPSCEDERLTKRLLSAAQVVGIELIDHIIIGDREIDEEGIGFYSFFHEEEETEPEVFEVAER